MYTYEKRWSMHCRSVCFHFPGCTDVRPITPTLTASVTNSTIKTETKLTLTCASTSTHGISSNSISYTFLKNKKTISPPPPPGSQYTVNTSQPSDKTSYTCKVDINGVSSLSSLEHSVRVVGEFTWSLFLSEITVFFLPVCPVFTNMYCINTINMCFY